MDGAIKAIEARVDSLDESKDRCEERIDRAEERLENLLVAADGPKDVQVDIELEEEKEEPQKEFWTEMFKHMADQQIPELEEVREGIATIEKRANIKVKDYLGGGALHTPLQTITYSISKYYGELNADGEAHGRGILIYNDDGFQIGYWQNDECGTGNYININSKGEFVVGEYYMKDGREWVRGTMYKTDGTELKYDFF